MDHMEFEEIRDADYFDEKLKNLEKLVLSISQVVNDLSDKWDKFIKQREKLEELLDWMDRQAAYGDEQEEKNMKQTKPYKFKNLIKDNVDE